MNKISFSIFLGLFFLISFFVNQQTYAIYGRSAICNVNEIETSCTNPWFYSYGVHEPSMYYGPDCPSLDDPSFKSIAADDQFSIICKPVPILSAIKNQTPKYLPLLLIVLLIKIPIFLIFGFRSKKALLSLISYNFISTALLYIAFPYIFPVIFYNNSYSRTPLLLVILLIIILVITFESIFLITLLKQKYSRKKIIIASIAANVILTIIATILALVLLPLFGVSI